MLSLSYQESMSEVLDILNHTKKEDVDKIPKKFISFLKNNCSKDYIPKLDHTKKLEDMNLKPETRGIMGLIYRHYWCSPQERAECEKIIQKKEKIYQEELQQKYNSDNIFQNKPSQQAKKDENKADKILPQIYEESNILKKIINTIKSIF